MSNATDICLGCGALLAGDKRCRYCGTLAGSRSKTRRAAGEITISHIKKAALERGLFPGLLLMALAAAIAMAVYVIPVPLWFGPGTRMLLILGMLFIASALLVLLDAVQIGKSQDEYKVALGNPVRWFVLSLLFWFGAFPLYIRARSKLVTHQPGWAVGAATLASGIVLIMTLVGIGSLISKGTKKSKDKQTTELLLMKTLEEYGKGSLKEVPAEPGKPPGSP